MGRKEKFSLENREIRDAVYFLAYLSKDKKKGGSKKRHRVKKTK